MLSGKRIVPFDDNKSIVLTNNDANTFIKLNCSDTAGSENIQLTNNGGTDEAAIALTATATKKADYTTKLSTLQGLSSQKYNLKDIYSNQE